MAEEISSASEDHEVTQFADLSNNLVEAVRAALGPWMRLCVLKRLEGDLNEDASLQLEKLCSSASEEVTEKLHSLLVCDIADQWTNPLSIIRSAYVYPTEFLRSLKVAPSERDPFEVSLYPEDVYGIVPAAFADLGDEVHEAGIAWGVAKAYEHLRRRKVKG